MRVALRIRDFYFGRLISSSYSEKTSSPEQRYELDVFLEKGYDNLIWIVVSEVERWLNRLRRIIRWVTNR